MALNGFVAAMILVVLADSVLAFLIAWELMSLVSFFLVVEDHHQAESRRAGFIYLVMTHVGGVFLRRRVPPARRPRLAVRHSTPSAPPLRYCLR